MSFVDEDEIFEVLETMISRAWESAFGMTLATPWPRLPYADAMRRYGSDKPDTRFGHELTDVTAIFEHCQFRVFAGAIAAGGWSKHCGSRAAESSPGASWRGVAAGRAHLRGPGLGLSLAPRR